MKSDTTPVEEEKTRELVGFMCDFFEDCAADLEREGVTTVNGPEFLRGLVIAAQVSLDRKYG